MPGKIKEKNQLRSAIAKKLYSSKQCFYRSKIFLQPGNDTTTSLQTTYCILPA